jgi:hypothetical protein
MDGMTRTVEELAEIDEDILLMDGFNDAIIGYSQRIGEPVLAVYSWQKMVDVLVKDMSYEDAVEYIEYNCLGAWVGERTPIIVMSMEF